MKKTLKLIPAIAMLLISAVLVSTSTYAWFTMNKTVSAIGMQVKARAEGGIVIYRTGGVRETATTTVSSAIGGVVALLPTSTADATNWYHAEGTTDSNGAGVSTTYKSLTFATSAPVGTAGSEALGLKYVANASDSTDKSAAYVLYDTYYIVPDKNSSSYENLWVSECTVSGASKDLSKSLRVAFVCGSNVVICAPVEGADCDYTVNQSAAVAALDSHATGSTPFTLISSGTGANALDTSAGITTKTVNVYVYFEGEDENHTTTNLATGIENLTVTVRFSATSVAAGN